MTQRCYYQQASVVEGKLVAVRLEAETDESVAEAAVSVGGSVGHIAETVPWRRQQKDLEPLRLCKLVLKLVVPVAATGLRFAEEPPTEPDFATRSVVGQQELLDSVVLSAFAASPINITLRIRLISLENKNHQMI